MHRYMKPDVVKHARELFFNHDIDGSGEIEQEEFKTVRALPATVDHTLNAALVR